MKTVSALCSIFCLAAVSAALPDASFELYGRYLSHLQLIPCSDRCGLVWCISMMQQLPEGDDEQEGWNVADLYPAGCEWCCENGHSHLHHELPSTCAGAVPSRMIRSSNSILAFGTARPAKGTMLSRNATLAPRHLMHPRRASHFALTMFEANDQEA